MKVITLITRRPELTRAAFKDYYEDHHAPLGTRHFPFEKYVRNHLVESNPDDVGFDCLMECWIDREKALVSLDGALGDLFAEDEARFMVNRGIGVDVVEHVVAGPPRAVDPRGVRKVAWLLAAGGIDRAEFLRLATKWGKELSETTGAARAVVDEVLPGHQSPLFAADAVLILWLGGADAPTPIDPPAGITVQAMLVLDSQETPPEELAAAYATKGPGATSASP